jgi:integrase
MAKSQQKRSNGEGSIQEVAGRAGYRAQVLLSDGSRPTKQCKTKSEARTWIREQQRLDLLGLIKPRHDMTVDEWFTTWFETRVFKVAPSTFGSNKSLYRLYFDPLKKTPLAKVTPGQINDWLAKVEHEGMKRVPGIGQPHTVRHCYALLSAAMTEAMDHDLIYVNPMARVKRPRLPAAQPKYMELDDIMKLLRACDETGDPRALAIHLMARLGLRRNESLGLVWEDIDLEKEVLYVRFQIGRVPDPDRPGKTLLIRRELKTMTSRRQLRLAGDLVEMLKAHRDAAPYEVTDQTFVVSYYRGKATDPDALTQWLKRVAKTVDVEVSPHRLRHSAATLMLNKGASIEAVSKVLGHSDIRITGVYAKVLDETSAAALDLLAEELDAQE